MKKQFTLTAFVENTPGVLHRLTIIFTRRRVNIESLTVSETEEHHISRFTIVVRLEEYLVPTIVRQLSRIIEVRRAFASEDEDLLFREIALITVRTGSAEAVRQVAELAREHGARTALTEPGQTILEKTGAETEIDALRELFEPYGIQEFVRSGRIAIRRSAMPNEIGIAVAVPAPEAVNTADAL